MDSFEQGSSQANFNQIVAALKAKSAELDQILAQARVEVAQLGTVSREGLASQQASARELSAAKPAQTGTGTVAQTTTSVERLAAAEAEVNRLLVQQLELRGRNAAAAAGQAAGGAGRTPGGVIVPGGGLPPIVAAAGGAGTPRTLKDSTAAAAKQAEQDRLVASARAQTISIAGVSSEMERNILITTQASNAYSVHGAMTTEFINAAAKGQVTLREFGSQISSTIGKFAGWTAAAGGVYGVIGAVSALARGAIDGSTAVQMLHRTIDGLNDQKASEAIVGLAHETNTSMQEAGNAVFVMSRTFHTLDSAVGGAKLGLEAYMLDQVPLADSVKALTALHLQYGLSMEQLGGVYNVLALGQQQMAARMQVTVPFMITAAGAAKIAGTSYSQLAQIAVYTARVTQSTGPQIATALARSMSTFVKKPASQKIFEQLGLPGEMAITAYGDFFKLALEKSLTMTRDQRALLATAFGGPMLGSRQFSRIISGATPDLLRQMNALTPESAKNKLPEELGKLLGTSEQQIKGIANDFQQLGASLGNSGLQEPLKLLVGGLRDAMQFSTHIFGVWSKMPELVKAVAGIGLGGLAVRGIGQHFNVPLPGMRQSAEQLRQTQVATGLGAQTAFYSDAASQTSRAAASANLATLAAVKTRDETLAANKAGLASDTALARDEEALELAARRQLALQAQTTGEREMALASVQLQNEYNALIAAGLRSQAAETKVGIGSRLTTLEMGTPVKQPVVAAGEGAAAGKTGVAAAAAATAAQTNALTAATAVEAQKIGYWGAVKARFATTIVAEEAAEIGCLTAIEAENAAITAAAIETQALARSTPILAGTLGRFAIAALATVLSVSEISKSLKAAKHASQSADKALAETAQDWADYNSTVQADQRDQIANFKKQRDQAPVSGVPILKDIVQWGNNLPGISQINDLTGFNDDYYKKLRAQGDTASSAALFEQLSNRSAADSKRLRGTEAGRTKWYAEQQNFIAQAQAIANKDPNAVAPLAVLMAVMNTQYQDFQRRISLLKVTEADPFGGAQRLNLPDNLKAIQALSDRQKVYGPDSGALKQAVAAWTWVASHYAGRTDSTSLQAIDQARTAALGMVTDNVTALLDAAKVASPAGATADFAKARQVVAAFEAQLKAGYAAKKKQVDALLRYYETITGAGRGEPVRLTELGAAALHAYQNGLNELHDLGLANSQITAQLGATKQSIYAARTGFTDPAEKAQMQAQLAKAQDYGDPVAQAADDRRYALQEQKAARTLKQKMQAQLDLAQADQEMQQAQQDVTALRFQILEAQAAGDPSAQAGLEIQAANALIASAHTNYQRMQGQLALVNAQNSAHDAAVALTQSGFDLQKAQASGDPVKQAQIDIAAANAAIAQARGQKELNDARAKLASADYSLSQAIESRTQSRFTFLESQTTDPVKQAQIALQAANEAVANAAAHGGTNTEAYYSARANQNKARQGLVSANLSDKESTIDFKLQLQRISTETAIQEYQALLNMHGITKQMRQQILEKIKQLKDAGQSEFAALDLGTIRMPTPYEIRRAYAGLRQQAMGNSTNHYNTTINVNDAGGATAVGVVMDRYHSGTGKSISRATGTR